MCARGLVPAPQADPVSGCPQCHTCVPAPSCPGYTCDAPLCSPGFVLTLHTDPVTGCELCPTCEPPPPPAPGSGLVWNDCGSACPRTCENPDPQMCTMNCVAGYFCADPTLLRLGDACVTRDACPPPSSPPPLLGGYTAVADLRDPALLSVVNCALHKVDLARNTPLYSVATAVLAARVQVVAGRNYRVLVSAAPSACLTTGAFSTLCASPLPNMPSTQWEMTFFVGLDGKCEMPSVYVASPPVAPPTDEHMPPPSDDDDEHGSGAQRSTAPLSSAGKVAVGVSVGAVVVIAVLVLLAAVLVAKRRAANPPMTVLHNSVYAEKEGLPAYSAAGADLYYVAPAANTPPPPVYAAAPAVYLLHTPDTEARYGLLHDNGDALA